MRLVFMGTPDFAAAILNALASKHEVIAVYTQPPRPAGKGMRPRVSPVQTLAEKLGIPVFSPVSLKKPAEQEAFRALNVDMAVVCAYGLILPPAVLEAPRLGCWNVHASLLPRWRGAAPIQRAIEAGDTATGITIMQMDPGLDTGPMLLTAELPITPDTTAGTLHDALAALGAQSILKALETLPAPVPQPETGATYAAKISKEEALIDFTTADAATLARKIRALSPYPGAYFWAGGDRIKVLNARAEETHYAAAAGTFLPGARVVCRAGTVLRLLTLQRAGKKALSAAEFLKGFALTQEDNA